MLKKLSHLTALLIAFVCASCQLEDNTLNVKRNDSVYPERLSLSALGEERNIEINIEDSWTVRVEESDVDWISVDNFSGSGADVIKLRSLKKEKEYSTEIHIVSEAGTFSIPIVVDEAYYLKDGFDSKRSSTVFPFPQIGYFAGWDRFGMGAGTVTYSGSDAYVTGLFGSFGYNGASGVNNVWLEGEGSFFDVKDIDVSLSEDQLFSVRFNARSLSSGGDVQVFDPSELSLSVSSNNDDYIPLAYSVTGEEWKCCSSSFSISHTDKVSLRFLAAKGGIYLDDIMLMVADGSPQEGDFVVRTSQAENISKTAAELSGSFVYTESGDVENIGFEYKMADGMSEVVTIPVVEVESVFGVEVSDLQEGETYLYRAYAETTSGELLYGQWEEFITLVDPVDMKVSDVRSLYDGTFRKVPAGWVLEGTVVSDYRRGNFMDSQFAFTDGTGPSSGIVVNIVDDGNAFVHQIHAGTQVSISLRGAKLKAELPVQLEVELSQITVGEESQEVLPIRLESMSELDSYDGMYVSLEGVQATAKSVYRPWGYGINEAEGDNYIEVVSNGQSCLVRTIPTAEHRLDIVSQNSGTLAGIVMKMDGDRCCVMPRSLNDINMESPRVGELTEKIVYYEDFGSAAKAKFAQYTGYTAQGQNPNNVTFDSESVNGQVYTSTIPSSGYTGATGGHHGYVNSEPREIYMRGLNTTGGGRMYFTMGASYMVTNPSLEQNKGNLVIKCSVDKGKTWVQVPINVLEPGEIGSIWSLIEFDRTFVIPESDDLWLYFFFKKNQGRMDDLKLIGYK